MLSVLSFMEARPFSYCGAAALQGTEWLSGGALYGETCRALRGFECIN